MKVFISYSHGDAELANRVVSSLQNAGLDVWYDKQEILPGDNWGDKIGEGLRESDAMVVLLTAKSLESEYAQWNIDYALSQKPFKRRVIPVLVGNSADLPPDRIPWIINHLHTIRLPENATDEKDFNQIARMLKDAA